jgi:hypothetical protein
MEWELFCEEQAELCEQRAAELGDKASHDWLQMAEDWRRMAEEPAPPFVLGPASRPGGGTAGR